MADLTAEQRYQKFLVEKSNTIQNVPFNYIAPFVAIVQKYLSH
jgi:CRP/FNR family transcriptional regulator, anaerobic regulatory protein